MIRVVFNKKGGVGKSTIVANLAAIDAALGRRTLVVDLDAQCNASQYLLGDAFNERPPGIAEFFEQTLSFSIRATSIRHYVAETPFEALSLISASPNLAEMQSKLEARHKIFKLRDALKTLDEFERIYIDTPPALNFFTVSALIAADRCLIPFDCDDFSRRAIYALLENVEEIRQDHNAELEVEGIIVNQFQSRSNLPQQIVQELIDEGLPILPQYLSGSIKVKESHQVSKPLVHLDRGHKLTQEYLALHALLDKPKRSKKK
jgi:chromosome partitioning protein